MERKLVLLKRKNEIFPAILIIVASIILFLYPLNKMEAIPGFDKKINEEWVCDSSKYQKRMIFNTGHVGQIIPHLKQENGDCTHVILITDTTLICMESPQGFGNELEISNNHPDDQFYFENEHNSVWYKFQAKESCYLSFDIIPFNKNDDYDFMLFKYTGGDFHAMMISKNLKPVRTCISRNDKNVESKTGLQLDGPVNYFVHSGVGASYVTYIAVEKGETYYLAIDNVYKNGSGHSIHFHYKCHSEDELYVGKKIALDSINYLSDEYNF